MTNAYIVSGKLIDNETIKLFEPLPIKKGKIRVVIEPQEKRKPKRKELYGILKGKISMAEDFNAPLDCFKEYV